MVRRAFAASLAVVALGAAAHAVGATPAAVPPPAVLSTLKPPLAQMISALPADRQAEVGRFYAARRGERAWSEAAAADFLAAINAAPRHGLDAKAYVPQLDRVRDPLERDVRLTAAALLYARHLAHGRVDPAQVERLWELRRNTVDVVAGLDAALRAGTLRPWVEGLAPDDIGYRNLSTGYLRYRKMAEEGGWPAFVAGRVLRPGEDDARVPALVARLVAEGDLPRAIEGTVYTEELVPFVQAFQTRHGLDADGVIGADTQAALAATAEDRTRQIALNLERRRWLPRQLAAERIEVNTAAAIMVYWRDGQPYHASRVVVGTPRNQTPSLEKEFSTLVANPPWYVPTSIASGELFPREAREPGYLASQGMRVVDGRIIQAAGPLAALGKVKFELRDSYSIYLHDTPAKSVFASARRHRSHGCVRVQDAVEFARMVLEPDPTALAAYDALIASGQTRQVRLGRSIPVRLLYWTAFVDGQGRVAFRPDVYGRDAGLARALGVDVYLPNVTNVEDPNDVGP